MSRVGKLPISLPDKVSITLSGDRVTVKGPRGELARAVPSGVTLKIDGPEVRVTRTEESRDAAARHGLVRSLVQSMVTGVSSGFKRGLEIVGVGYRAEMRGRFLHFNLGYSHPILFELPAGISAKVEGGTRITLEAADKEALGQTAATIRAFRPPEPYKGKGIRFEGETIRTKVGKAGA
jgi:large subunit ribosomal protein L6